MCSSDLTDGFEVSFSGSVAGDAGVGIGVSITDARGINTLGAAAGAGGSVAARLEATWSLPLAFPGLGAIETVRLMVLAVRDPLAALAEVRQKIETAIRTIAPDTLVNSIVGEVKGETSGGLAVASVAGEVSASDAIRSGWDDHGSFVELEKSGAAKGSLSVLFTELDSAGASTSNIAEAGVAVRVEGDVAAALTGDFSDIRWVGRVKDGGEQD